jgi:hypothetical protein
VWELKFLLVSATNVWFSSNPALVTPPPSPGKVVRRKVKRGHFDTEEGQTSRGDAREGWIKMISQREVTMAHSLHLHEDAQRDEVRSGFQPLYFLGGDGAQRGRKGGVSSSLGFWVFLAD